MLSSNFFDAVEKLKKNTELEMNDPEYVDPDDVFLVIDIPG